MSPFICNEIFYCPGSLPICALDRHPLDQLSCGVGLGLFDLWAVDDDAVVREETNLLRMKRREFVQVVDVNISIPTSLQRQALEQYFSKLEMKQQNRQNERATFNYSVSNWRCCRPLFHINWRMVRAVQAPNLALLAMRSRHDCHLAAQFPPCWSCLIKTEEERMESMLTIVERFVFVIPKIHSIGPALVTSKTPTISLNRRAWSEKALLDGEKALKAALVLFYPAQKRQQMFFPDRNLIQFDSGKLQTLTIMLRDLKKGGHKCLIFTQMSKMLDILEIFLNLHAHTYVRLDGSTGVEKRQKLMDRFNSDPKLFCFILSTRSGGLGINLTGADTVIFFDSDWNPAMDAQAQDRAHRIGQKREVNIYRLVCANTVEENILKKAQQKRHLDFLVMTEGNFSETSIFSASGLQDVLGVSISGNEEKINDMDVELAGAAQEKLGAEIEAAMAAAEDDEDVAALKVVRHEEAEEQQEFNENDVPHNDVDDDDDDDIDAAQAVVPSQSSLPTVGNIEVGSSNKTLATTIDAATEEKDMEAEFAKWQASVGGDFKSLESALMPVERFALRFHTDIEPYYSPFFVCDQQRMETLNFESQELDGQWDVDEIEREKEEVSQFGKSISFSA